MGTTVGERDERDEVGGVDGHVDDEPHPRSTRAAAARLIALLAGLLLLVPLLGWVLYGTTGRDDAYITFTAADRLRDTGRILNINGDAIEQSTSLLFTVLLAAGSWISRIDIARLGFLLGILCGALTTVVAYFLGRALHPRGAWPAALIVATLGPFLYWSFSGMEISTAALALAFTMLVVHALVVEGVEPRLGWFAAVVGIAAVVTVRPEYGMALLVALAGSAGVARVVTRYGSVDERRRFARVLLIACAVTAVCLAAVIAFRLAAFGEAFPRPIVVKQGSGVASKAIDAIKDPQDSTTYLRDSLVQSGTFVALLAAIGGFVYGIRTGRIGWLLVGATAFVGLGVVVLSGGDWMEAGRLVAPWIVLAGILAGAAIGALEKQQWIVGATVVVVGANLLGNINYVRGDSTGYAVWERAANRDAKYARAAGSAPWEERWNEIHRRDVAFVRGAAPVVQALTDTVPGRPRVASSQAGMVAYYLAKDDDAFEFVDQGGLSTTQLDRCNQDVKPSRVGKPLGLKRWIRDEKCGPLPEATFGLGRLSLTPRGDDYFDEIFATHMGLFTQFIAVRNDLAPRVRERLREQGWECPDSGLCSLPRRTSAAR